MCSRTKIIAITVVSVCVLGVLSVGSYAAVALYLPGDYSESSGDTIEFPVEQGQTLRGVSEKLHREGLIGAPRLLELYGRVTGRAAQIRAGTYPIAPGLSAAEILETLVSGRVLDESIRVTIPEGWSIYQIASRLEEFGIIQADVFLDAAVMDESLREYEVLVDLEPGDTLEGFLYPETYRFDRDSGAEKIITRMLETFTAKVGDTLLDNGAEERRFTVHELVTLASIVQHESPTADMPDVAGVFDNRLRAGRRLESDATVNYVLGTSHRRPTFAQVLTESPYNTYRQTGLPPTPIGNPGRDAIEAAVSPEEHPYYFFLHPLDGRTVLSRTYEQHLENAERYLD
ncbi:MAG: endolytic transglycosylase MltG [bacterium]